MDEKYKVRALCWSENDWESQYIKPSYSVGNVVMVGDPEHLNQHFKTEKDANDYTVQHLKKQNLNSCEIKLNS